MTLGQRRKCRVFLSFFVIIIAVSSCARVPRQKLSLPHRSIHFPFNNEYFLREELYVIYDNAEWMKNNPDAVLILEGHCDEVGPAEYNVELGDRRARTVKSYLIESGVPYDRIIMVVSLGENSPFDPAHNRIAWRKNRRVEFILR